MNKIWEVKYYDGYIYIYGRRGTKVYRNMTLIDAIANYIR